MANVGNPGQQEGEVKRKRRQRRKRRTEPMTRSAVTIALSRYASASFFAALVFGTLLMIFGNLFIDELMVVLGSTKTVLPYARDYAGYILYGAPVMCCVFLYNHIIGGFLM